MQRCAAASDAELIVLPETVTTGFSPGCSAQELWDLATPDQTVEPFRRVRAKSAFTWSGGRTPRDRSAVSSTAALIADPSGEVLGVYHKTHPFCTSRAPGGWVTPGDDSCVVDTALGRIGLIICFDGDYPELSRITALQGAEVICRPSALLRSADIWELTNRARAYDNHVFVVGANATGTDPAGVIYFGNSMIVSPIAEVIARGSSHESWVAARLDPATAMASLTPGSSVPQVFDHLADRNLDLIRRYRDLPRKAGSHPCLRSQGTRTPSSLIDMRTGAPRLVPPARDSGDRRAYGPTDEVYRPLPARGERAPEPAELGEGVSCAASESPERASELLRQVEQGESIEITDRGRPVAMLSPLPSGTDLLRLIAAGQVDSADADLSTLPEPLPLDPEQDAPSEILARLRRDER